MSDAWMVPSALQARLARHLGTPAAVPPLFHENPTSPDLVWGVSGQGVDRGFALRCTLLEGLARRYLEHGHMAVDVAGGAGRWIRTLSRTSGLFLHMDLSIEALRRAYTDHSDLGNVAYAQSNLWGSSGVRDADVVYCIDTLEYPGPFCAAALRAVRGTLAPGGIAVLEFPAALRSRAARALKGSRWHGPRRTWRVQEACEACRAAGLRVIDRIPAVKELPMRLWDRRWSIPVQAALLLASTWFYLVARPQAEER